MFTGNAPQFIRHSYLVKSSLKTYTVYQLEKPDITGILPEVIRVEVFRNKSRATNIKTYLRFRTATSWVNSEMVTGLRPTLKPGVFYGDWKRGEKKSLLIFNYSANRERLTIDVFRGFYPNHKGILLDLLRKY